MKYALLIVSVFLTYSSASADGDCPTKALLSEDKVNPIDLKTFLRTNSSKIKSIQDFICCLPKSYRRNYFVAHSSIAAQNGSVKSPRVLMHDSNRGTPIECILSFNGGGEGLFQADSVEMICDNKRSGVLEAFDIDFSERKFNGIQKNPELCLSCHGDKGVSAVGGLKPIFSHAPWGRFMGSGLLDNAPGCTRHERQLAASAEKAAKAAMENNSRYKCLEKKSGVEDSFAELETFEQKLRFLNDRRVAQIVRQTKDYDRFKYVIIGSQICSENFRVQDWIPADILKSINEVSFVDSQIRSEMKPFQAFSRILDLKMNEHMDLGKTQQKAAKEIEDGSGFHAPFDDSVSACLTNDSSFLSGGTPKDALKHEVKGALTGSTILDQYVVDTKLQSFRGKNSINPNLRFLFEGRGIEVSGWSMSPTPGYHDEFALLSNWLIVTEPESSPLKKMFSTYARRRSLDFSSDSPLSGSPKSCSALRALSIAALGRSENPGKVKVPSESNGIRSRRTDQGAH